jgi:hypothetical protein
VIHTAFIHDFADFAAAAQTDRRAVVRRARRSRLGGAAPTVGARQGRSRVRPAPISIARDKGVSAYVGDGSNRWAAEEGVPFRDIAEVIGRQLNLPVIAISREEADGHFGFLGPIVSLDTPALSTLTQKLLGWHPTQPRLIADLEEGRYFNDQLARLTIFNGEGC